MIRRDPNGGPRAVAGCGPSAVLLSEINTMTKRRYRQYRLAGKLAIVLAAAPMFQFAQCASGVRQVSANMFNSLPSTIFSIWQGFALAPIQLLLSGGG